MNHPHSFVFNGKEFQIWTEAQLEKLNRATLHQRAVQLREHAGADSLPPMPRQPEALVQWILHVQAALMQDAQTGAGPTGYARGGRPDTGGGRSNAGYGGQPPSSGGGMGGRGGGTGGGKGRGRGDSGGGWTSSDWRSCISSGTLIRDDRMQKIRTMFDAMDEDGSHVVTKAEFIEFMQSEGHDPSEAADLFGSIDESHTGRFTLAKFDHYVATHTLQIVRDTFKALDDSHDRQVDRKEFVRYFLGNGLTKEQANNLWQDMDKDRNGRINFFEYRDWAQEAFQSGSLDQVAKSLGLS